MAKASLLAAVSEPQALLAKLPVTPHVFSFIEIAFPLLLTHLEAVILMGPSPDDLTRLVCNFLKSEPGACGGESGMHGFIDAHIMCVLMLSKTNGLCS